MATAHFYDSDGNLHAYVEYADKTRGMREATLADARKNGWNPSVTTVLNSLDKPQLTDWRVYEALKVALPMGATEVTADVLAAVKRESEAYRNWSADFGTQVHHMVSLGLQGDIPSYVGEMLGARDVAEGFLDWMGPNGLQVTASELSFSSSLGYGGTIDILGTWYGEPIIGDIKTQNYGGPDERQQPLLYDPEWPLQMAGYDIGLVSREPQGEIRLATTAYEGYQPLTRISFVLSRTRPGLVVAHQWKDNERYDAAWLSLWDHWQATHKWGKWAARPALELLQGGLTLDE